LFIARSAGQELKGSHQPVFRKPGASKPSPLQNDCEIMLTSTLNNPQPMEAEVRRVVGRHVEDISGMTFDNETKEMPLKGLRVWHVPLVSGDDCSEPVLPISDHSRERQQCS